MDLTEELKKNIERVFGIEISFSLWKEQEELPFFLTNAYIFFETSILHKPCLMMISKDSIEPTPYNIEKHWTKVCQKWGGPCIYVSNTISSYNRQRLIQLHIPFIIPDNQIYVPDLGIDLREHFKQQRIHKKIFSPAAQIVIISTLLSKKNDKLIPSELAVKLGYSYMTMTRVFNELEAAGIGKVTKKGKERWWIFEDSKKELWEQTKGMLRSPVKTTQWMKQFPGAEMPQIPLAGISALAETTMINPPKIPILAMDIEAYKQVNIPKGLQLAHIDDADIELEIWNYNPSLFPLEGHVDAFSLYLSLRETTDERIEMALQELMEKIQW